MFWKNRVRGLDSVLRRDFTEKVKCDKRFKRIRILMSTEGLFKQGHSKCKSLR